MSYKISQCYSPQSLSLGDRQDDQGRIFINPSAMVDLSSVLICGASVDTVRQLFWGLPATRAIEKLIQHTESKDEIISLYDVVYDVLPGTAPRKPLLPKTVLDNRTYDRWHFSRMGKNSGFRYKLQNNDIGIVILFGSFYCPLDRPGQHLKIELSPHFISSRSTAELWAYLHTGQYALSQLFLQEPVPQGCAVHLACDYQGFDLPQDFLAKFSTSCRIVRSFDGINEIDLSNLSEASVTYGSENQAKNYMLGKPTAIQFVAYDKGYEAVKSDKIDYFYHEWATYTEGEYDPRLVTRRIELRFHHTVLRDIGNGLGLSFEAFPDLVPHLTDIFRYGMERNRLNQDKHYIAPFWQLLMRDVEFFHPAQNTHIVRKKKESVDPLAHNITAIIGNAITICARKGMKVNRFMVFLRVTPFYPEIVEYYARRGISEDDLKEKIHDELLKRRIIGKAA